MDLHGSLDLQYDGQDRKTGLCSLTRNYSQWQVVLLDMKILQLLSETCFSLVESGTSPDSRACLISPFPLYSSSSLCNACMIFTLCKYYVKYSCLIPRDALIFIVYSSCGSSGLTLLL